MKKLLSFLFLLLVPFVVHAADVEIKSITELERTGDIEVNSDPTFEGLKINFDLAFTNVDDSVTYKVVVKNNTNEDLEIEEEAQYGKDKYIKYSASFADGSNVIKAKTEKEITLKATYDKEIPVSEFDNGVYNEKGNVSISFVGEKENPLTSTYLPVTIIAIAIIATIAIVLAKHGMKKTGLSITILTLVALPIISNAVRKISFDIEAKIFIQDRCYTLDTEFGSFEEGREVKSICVDFTENKYVLEDYYFIQSLEPTGNQTKLVLNVFKEHLKENSYVRVYDENDQLLVEVTTKDFPKSLFQVEPAVLLDSQRAIKMIGDYTRDNVRLEISEDLQEYNAYDVAHFMYAAEPAKIPRKGPWIADQTAINKIEYLGNQEYNLKKLSGFERDSKDSHLYHALWLKPEK